MPIKDVINKALGRRVVKQKTYDGGSEKVVYRKKRGQDERQVKKTTYDKEGTKTRKTSTNRRRYKDARYGGDLQGVPTKKYTIKEIPRSKKKPTKVKSKVVYSKSDTYPKGAMSKGYSIVGEKEMKSKTRVR